MLFINQNPFHIFVTFYWFFKKGRWYLKSQLEKKIPLNIPSLPWNSNVLDWLHEEKQKNRELVLVTGANHKYAQQVAFYLGLFSKVFGVCEERPRLTGRNKAKFLVAQYGAKKFDYIGNSYIDYHVWKQARYGIMVKSSFFIFSKLKSFLSVQKIILEMNRFWNHFQDVWNVIPWTLILMRLFFVTIAFFIPLLLGNHSHIVYLLHVYIVICFLFSSVLFQSELKYLHQDRIHKRNSLFMVLHPYWGLCFVPLFLFGMGYMIYFLPNIVLWAVTLFYFSLECCRFFFRSRILFYEIAVNLLLLSYASLFL